MSAFRPAGLALWNAAGWQPKEPGIAPRREPWRGSRSGPPSAARPAETRRRGNSGRSLPWRERGESFVDRAGSSTRGSSVSYKLPKRTTIGLDPDRAPRAEVATEHSDCFVRNELFAICRPCFSNHAASDYPSTARTSSGVRPVFGRVLRVRSRNGSSSFSGSTGLVGSMGPSRIALTRFFAGIGRGLRLGGARSALSFLKWTRSLMSLA